MERLDKWMSIVANLGVLAGIVFLAFEIQVNTDAVRAESATNWNVNWMSEVGENARNDETSRIVVKANSEGLGSLPPDHLRRITFHGITALKAAEHAHYQWSEGNLDDRLWRANDRALYQAIWNGRFLREVWIAGGRNNFYQDFVSYLDSMIDNVCSSRECPEMDSTEPDLKFESALENWASTAI